MSAAFRAAERPKNFVQAAPELASGGAVEFPEYVKICSLYGAGFYYMPGTDICVKIGGYVRWQKNFGTGSSSVSFGPFHNAGSNVGGRHTRLDSTDYAERTRAVISWDTRQQTAFGTLRTYWLLGHTTDLGVGGAAGLYANRGFIQIAGFTFGLATSFFDFVSTAAVAYNAGYVYNSDTGDAGQHLAAYTAQFGNGFSATIAAEAARRSGTVFLGVGTANYSLTTLANPAGNNLGGANLHQDLVVNLRVDQAWGSAQVSAALHEVSAGYFGGSELAGSPSDEWGFAVSGGLKINTPMIGAGDYFQGMVIYAEGATRYAALGRSSGSVAGYEGATVGYGFFEDAVFTVPAGATAGNIELTTAWSVFASFEHNWSPNWKTSVYGSYIDVSHNAPATAAICASGGAYAAGCNPDWSSYIIGSRTEWAPVRGLTVGLDLTYLYLETSSPNAANLIATAGSGAKPAFVYAATNQEAWQGTFRVQRNVMP
jgi:hypothetical protein